jgi:hypothetical protein
MSERPVSGILVPPSQFRKGDPPTKPAEIAVWDYGENKPEAVRALLDLAGKDRNSLWAAPATPYRSHLPGTHYEPDDPLVSALRETGCRFQITQYAWVCPNEENSKHFCRPTCSVVEMVETVR